MLQKNVSLPSEYYNIMLDTLSELIWLKDINGVYLHCNKQFEMLFGATKEQIVGKTDFDFVSHELATFFRKHDLNAMNADQATINEEWITYASNGKRCYFKTTKTPMRNSKNELIGILGIGHDITYRKKTEDELNDLTQKLNTLASIDSLTQIPNRRIFDEHLVKEWQHCKREKSSIALIILDVDYFKKYNDLYGHAAGDDCLRNIGELLKGNQFTRRANDLVARYGGEEFAIILSKTDINGALNIAENLRKAIENLEIPHASSEVKELKPKIITISLGVAVIQPNINNNKEDLFSMADEGLYQAKSHGRNQYRLGINKS